MRILGTSLYVTSAVADGLSKCRMSQHRSVFMFSLYYSRSVQGPGEEHVTDHGVLTAAGELSSAVHIAVGAVPGLWTTVAIYTYDKLFNK